MMECKPIETRAVGTWQELKAELDRFPPGWAFRGQADSTWGLQTSLERIAGNLEHKIVQLIGSSLPEFSAKVEALFGTSLATDEVDIATYVRDCVPQYISENTNVAKDLEVRAISMFRARAHHYLMSHQIPAMLLEWTALMQHHGAPTRLLDWTYSPYVASFFALEDARSSCAIWAIDIQWLASEGLGLLERAGVLSPDLVGRLQPGTSRAFDLVFTHDVSGVFPCVPDRLNERLTMQQGLFVAYGNSKLSFMQNLNALGDALQGRLLKIEAPNSIAAEALADLHKMNVNRATLFPGIDGFAQSIRHQVIIESDMGWAKSLVDKLFGSQQFLTGAFATALTTLPNLEGMADIVGDKGMLSPEQVAKMREWLQDRRKGLPWLHTINESDATRE